MVRALVLQSGRRDHCKLSGLEGTQKDATTLQGLDIGKIQIHGEGGRGDILEENDIKENGSCS